MSLMDLLKIKKKKLLTLEESIKENVVIETPKIPEIEIKNHHSIFENEEEEILKGAQIFLDDKRVDSFEEGIIVFATMIRGLKYRGVEKDEDGNTTKIIFADIELEDTNKRSL